MKIDRIRGGVLGVVACGAMLGCGAQTGDGGDASAQEQVRVIHYRHGSELLEAKFRGDPQAPELLDGPDNDRLQQLMSEPTSGLATDPSDENLFWIYDNDAEGRRISQELRQRQLDAKPNALPTRTLSLFPPGSTGSCPSPRGILYRDDNEGGGSFSFSGAVSNLGTFSFNDASSSVYAKGGAVVLYEHANYGGHSLTLDPDVTVMTSDCPGWAWYVHSLSRYDMISSWFWRISWNDQASSVAFLPW
jgi:hypothetical protein